MVEVLEPYSQALTSIKQDLPNILRQILIDNISIVLKILKEDQLAEGIDSKGNIVGRYSYLTEQYADEERQASGGKSPRQDKIAGEPFNFEWTGGLFDNMYLEFEDKQSFSLFSADEKAKMLEKEYGDIFTLTKQNNHRINQELLRPKMYDAIIQRLYV